MIQIGTKVWRALMLDFTRQIALTTLIVCLVGMAGCRAEPDEHEEESHFPPHWPKTFLVAADRLEQIAANPTGTPTLAESVEQELADLVDWLPELLADSDISKEDFDRIDGWAFPLSIEFKSSVKAGKKIEELSKNETFRQGLAGLTDLARLTRKRLEEARVREEQEAAEAERLASQDGQVPAPNSGNN